MLLSRRQVFMGTGCLAMGVMHPALSGAKPSFKGYASCARMASGKFAVGLLSARLDHVDFVDLPMRGHGMALDYSAHRLVVLSRRPGRVASVINVKNRTLLDRFECRPGRHFMGHGAFSSDGRFFYASENDYENERGEVAVYDALHGFQFITAYSSGGIGPHEIILLRDQKTLAIANGGILTHPDFPRQKLNLADMRPSLCLLNGETGDIVQNERLPEKWHQLSIRHVAEAQDGTVWFGCQYEGARSDRVPLVGRMTPYAPTGQALEMLSLPGREFQKMQHYIGSMAASHDGRLIAATGPRGDQTMIIDSRSFALKEVVSLPDGGGAAAFETGFILSSGHGALNAPNVHLHHGDIAWDNHMLGWGQDQDPRRLF